MARIRSVKPELCLSETMAKLSAEEERTFIRLWTHCDDEGRAKDHPKLLKAALFPLHDDVTPEVIDAHLEALARVGLIVRYTSGSAQTLTVTHWREHQHPQKPVPSKLPAPDPADLRIPQIEDVPTVGLQEESRPVVEVGVVDVDVVGEVVPITSAVAAGSTDTLPTRRPKKPKVDAGPAFDEFYRVYPKKADPHAAKRAWLKAIKDVDPETLIAAAQGYRDDPNREDRYTKNPATWLNAGSWANDPLPPRGGSKVDATRRNLVSAIVDQPPTFKERMAAAGRSGITSGAEQAALGSGS